MYKIFICFCVIALFVVACKAVDIEQSAPHVRFVPYSIPGSQQVVIIEDRDTGEEYMVNSAGGIVHVEHPKKVEK